MTPYVNLPEEDRVQGGERLCGKLLKAMFVTSHAAQKWQRTCSESVRELGVKIEPQ